MPLEIVLRQLKDQQEELKAYRARFGEIMPERKNREAALKAGVRRIGTGEKSSRIVEVEPAGNEMGKLMRGVSAHGIGGQVVGLDDKEEFGDGSNSSWWDDDGATRGRRLSVQMQDGGSHARL